MFIEEINNENTDAQSKSHDYLAKLSDYEGPLDILLHFVKEEELNIYDIPIAKITHDFLEYINYMQKLDMEVAGEFLLMASELMKIKARMLLPQLDDEGQLIEEDPRITLVRKLLEYKRFKDISNEIAEMEKSARNIFMRMYFEGDERSYEKNFEEDKSLKNVTIYNIIKGYKTAIQGMKGNVVHPIEPLDISPETQREFLIEILNRISKIDFDELTKDMKEKIIIVCTFLSILQLALEGYIWIDVEPQRLSKFSIKRILEKAIGESGL
jgi:segregation and condensation protein A